MIVVSDTSPLNYLALIGKAEILHDLFGEVIVPTAVASASALLAVRDRATSLTTTNSPTFNRSDS